MATVKLAEEISANIAIRTRLQTVLEKVKKEKIITMDFKDVTFMSRSCADEYLKFKEKTKAKIIEKNISRDVQQMFDAVEANKDKQPPKLLEKFVVEAL